MTPADLMLRVCRQITTVILGPIVSLADLYATAAATENRAIVMAAMLPNTRALRELAASTAFGWTTKSAPATTPRSVAAGGARVDRGGTAGTSYSAIGPERLAPQLLARFEPDPRDRHAVQTVIAGLALPNLHAGLCGDSVVLAEGL